MDISQFLGRPPGEVLAEVLRDGGQTQPDVAEVLGLSTPNFNDVLRGRRPFTYDLAIRLEACKILTASEWGKIVWAYEEQKAKPKQETVRADVVARKRLKDLQARAAHNLGWLNLTGSGEDQAKVVAAFLGVPSLEALPPLTPLFRSKLKTEATHLWVAQAKRVASSQKVSTQFRPTDGHSLALSVLRLIPLENGPSLVGKTLSDFGVKFAVVPQLPGMRVDGALIRDDGQPIIVLSLRYDRIDWFWFTLLHELAHLYHEHSGEVFIDVMEDEASGAVEREADETAQKWLIPAKPFESFIQRSRGIFSAASVNRFASSIERPAGIVVGRLHREMLLPYSHLRATLTPVRTMLTEWSGEQKETA